VSKRQAAAPKNLDIHEVTINASSSKHHPKTKKPTGAFHWSSTFDRGRSTKVAEIVGNNLPRPRSATTLVNPEFVKLRSYCLDIFQREANASQP
jgi:hypothetical protein